MWDNATMLHRRDPVGERPLKRTTIALPAQSHVIPEGKTERATGILHQFP
jgi:hypothetical protein